MFEIEYLFIAKGGKATPRHRQPHADYRNWDSNLIYIFRLESKPFQEALMAGRVAALE